MPRRRPHFLDVRPSHVTAFPRCRQHREKSIPCAITRKIHHVEISQPRNTLHVIESIGQSKFSPDLIHDNTVDAPVEAILRRCLAHHHNRLERVNSSPLQHDAVFQGIHFIDHDSRKRVRQIDPVFTGNINVHEVARRIRALDTHASPIQKTACTGMGYHERTPSIRIFRERNIERGIVGLVRRHHRIVDKTQVILATGQVVLGRLFALHLLGTVIIDHRLIDLVNRRQDAILDEQLATACHLIIGVRKAKMFSPVMDTLATSRRIQVIRGSIGIEPSRSCRKRVVRRFILELHAQYENLERIHGMRQRKNAQQQCKNTSI